jgi:hypothetical protein
MQAQIQTSTIIRPADESPLAAFFETVHFQNRQTDKMKPAGVAFARISTPRGFTFVERGVPFSPLND